MRVHFAAVIALAACTAPINYSIVTPGAAHEDLVYAFQVVKQEHRSDRVYVIICHRFGNPPCVTVAADELADMEDYAKWRGSAARRASTAQGEGAEQE